MDDMQIRFGEERDAVEIASLLCETFRPEIAPLFIMGCKGAANYIRMQIASGGPIAEAAYFVAHIPGRVIGAVELRRTPGKPFFAYLSVHPDYRGKRIGAQLFAKALGLSGISTGQIGLEVFDDNLSAREWYVRLGFDTRQTADLIEIAPPDAPPEEPGYVSDLPQADLCHERFGFSRFNLITARQSYSIGRIGSAWFRLNGSAALTDPSVFSTLRRLDPGRRIFAVVPSLSVAPTQVAQLFATTHRMEAEVPRFLARL